MRRHFVVAFVCLVFFAICLTAAPEQHQQDWSNYVRIGAYGLKGGDAQQIVDKAQASDPSVNSPSPMR